MTDNKETAIPNEQQYQVIINEIVKIFADNNLTIEDADYVLRKTSSQIKRQTIKVS